MDSKPTTSNDSGSPVDQLVKCLVSQGYTREARVTSTLAVGTYTYQGKHRSDR